MKQKRWVTTIYFNLTPKLKSCLLVSLSSSLKFERCANSLLTRKPKTKSSLIAMFTLYNVWQLLKMIKKLMQEKKLNDVLCMIFSLKIPFFLEPSKVQPALSFSFYFIFIFFSFLRETSWSFSESCWEKIIHQWTILSISPGSQ